MLVRQLGEIIKKRRKELKITQPYLAELAEISTNSLYKLECGQEQKYKFDIKYFLVLFFALFFSAISFSQSRRNFEVSKNLDIYSSLLRELDLFYVDTVQIDKIVKSSIDKMLAELDPYTTYIPENETNDLRFMTTGEYGGVGSVITARKDGSIIFSEPYEGMPADKAGIKAGDILLEVDGIKLNGKSTVEVSQMLRGQPGTVVKVKFQHYGDTKYVIKEFTREKIQINPVAYYGIVGENTGYISLTQFTDKAVDEVKKAMLDLKKKHQITSLILDLRDNPGGIIDEAVKIANLFLPKSQLIVSTKGKVRQWDSEYRCANEPVDAEIPLVVLINGNSASASEIVAGAVQDLDRGVLVGARTFGKGLVQSTRELSYKAYLKVTTAKYYTPSGRCIQSVDYSHRNEDSIPKNEVGEYKTRGGRLVTDGGGITPDVEISDNRKISITYYLYAENMISEFASEYVRKHKKIASPEEFELSDADYEDFKQFLKNNNFAYKLKSTELLKRLKELAEIEGYGEIASEDFNALEKTLSPNIEKDVELFKKDIVQLLGEEIVKRYYYQKGAIRYQLRNDTELEKALEILNDKERYDNFLKI